MMHTDPYVGLPSQTFKPRAVTALHEHDFGRWRTENNRWDMS